MNETNEVYTDLEMSDNNTYNKGIEDAIDVLNSYLDSNRSEEFKLIVLKVLYNVKKLLR